MDAVDLGGIEYKRFIGHGLIYEVMSHSYIRIGRLGSGDGHGGSFLGYKSRVYKS
jgi:hypothetical protein